MKRPAYFTGKPCKRGHIAKRSPYVGCLECHRLREKAVRERNRKPRLVVVLSEEEKRDKRRAANRKSYAKHKAKRAAAAALRYAANPEKIKSYNKARYAADLANSRAALAVRSARRRARKAAVGGTHTVEDRQRTWGAQGGQCAYAKFAFPWCPQTLTRELAEWDHRVPLYLGGSNDAANGQWLCYSCNVRKGYKEESVFLERVGAFNQLICLAA